MPRRRDIQKRPITPDPKFNNKLVAKFINNLLEERQKEHGRIDPLRGFRHYRKKIKEQPLAVFEKALDNVRPVIEVKSRRVGGSTYQVPTEIAPERRTEPRDQMGDRQFR